MKSSNEDDVMLNENGDVYNPISLNMLIISKFMCCCIGIPLNAFVAIVLIVNDQLRSKPRTVFLLGIIFSYMSFINVAIIELIYWYLYPVESLCQAYVACDSLPHALLLLNVLLSLGDRYFAIKYPMFHRKKMTLRLACTIVICSSLLIIFIENFAFIVGLRTLRCEVWLVNVQLVTITTLVLYLICTALNFIVYRETKKLLCEHRTICSPTNVQLSSIVIYDPSDRKMSIHVDKSKQSQILVQATRSLVIGVVTLALTVCPSIAFSCVFLSCRFIVDERKCRYLNWIGPYVKELGLISAVCSPIIFIVRRKELRSAWTCTRKN